MMGEEAAQDMDNATMYYEGEDDEDNGVQKSMEYLFEVVLLSVAGAFGLVGNVAAVALFSRQGIQLKFHRLMMMLATFDLVYIILSLLLFTAPLVIPSYKSVAHPHVLPKALPIAQVVMTGSIYSTLAITVERYLTVCHPFFAFSHKWTSNWYISTIVSFSLVYNLPKFFELQTGVVKRNLTLEEGWSANVSGEEDFEFIYRIDPTEMRINEYYIKIYCIWMNLIFMGIIPFVLLIVLNSLMLRNLVQQNRSRAENAANMMLCNAKEVALAKISLTIVFIFIVCHSVKWIPNLYELWRLAMDDKRSWPPWVEGATHIAHFLMTLNSSTNFYIYCGKHFNCIPKVMALAKRRRNSTEHSHALPTIMTNVVNEEGEATDRRASRTAHVNGGERPASDEERRRLFDNF